MAMMREFTLDNSNGKSKGLVRFQILWTAMGYVIQTGDAKNIEILRREREISKKLRAISMTENVVAGNGIPAHTDRILMSNDQKLILDQPEIDMIRKKIEVYPFWNPLAEDSPADVYDWLSTGTEKEADAK